MTGRARPARVGLWLLGFCSLLDIATLPLTNGQTPPRAVALSAVPAFLAGDVPIAAVAGAAVVVVLDVAGVLLVAGGGRRVEVTS